MNSLQTFISAFLGGIAIALGCAASLILNTESTLVSALFLSMGLLAVAVFELSIFTDKTSSLFSKKSAAKQAQGILITLIGNTIGALLIGIATMPKLHEKASAIVIAKVDASFAEICIGSILCGVLIYIAMHGFRKSGGGFTGCAILVAASSVISVCGFDYALANTLYIGATCDSFKSYTKNIGGILMLVLFVALGNIIGATITSLLYQIKSEDPSENKHHRHKHHRHSHHRHSESTEEKQA